LFRAIQLDFAITRGAESSYSRYRGKQKFEYFCNAESFLGDIQDHRTLVQLALPLIFRLLNPLYSESPLPSLTQMSLMISPIFSIIGIFIL